LSGGEKQVTFAHIMDFLGFCKEFEADTIAASASMRASQEDDGSSTTNTATDYLIPEAVREGEVKGESFPSSPDFSSMMLSPKFSRQNAANKLLISVPSALSNDPSSTPRSTVSFSSQHQQQTYHPSAPVAATPKKSPTKKEPSYLSTMSAEEKSEIRRLLSSDANDSSSSYHHHQEMLSLSPLQKAAALKGKTLTVSSSVSSSTMSIAPPPPPLFIPSSSPSKPKFGALGYTADELATLGFSAHNGKWRGFPFDSYSCCNTSFYYCPKASKKKKQNDYLSQSVRSSSSGKRRKTAEEKSEEDRKKAEERNRKLLEEYGGKDIVNHELRSKYEALQQQQRQKKQSLSSSTSSLRKSLSSSNQQQVPSSSSSHSRRSSRPVSSPVRRPQLVSSSTSSLHHSSGGSRKEERRESSTISKHHSSSIPTRVLSPDSAGQLLFPSKLAIQRENPSAVKREVKGLFPPPPPVVVDKKEKIKVLAPSSTSLSYAVASPLVPSTTVAVKSPVKQYLSMLNELRKDVLTTACVPSSPSLLPFPSPVSVSLSPVPSPLPPPPPPIAASSFTVTVPPAVNNDTASLSSIRKKTFIIHPPSSPVKQKQQEVNTVLSINTDVDATFPSSKDRISLAEGEMELKENENENENENEKEKEYQLQMSAVENRRSNIPATEEEEEREEEVLIIEEKKVTPIVQQYVEPTKEKQKKTMIDESSQYDIRKDIPSLVMKEIPMMREEEIEAEERKSLLFHHHPLKEVNDFSFHYNDINALGGIQPSSMQHEEIVSSRFQPFQTPSHSEHLSSQNQLEPSVSKHLQERERRSEREILPDYRPVSTEKRRTSPSPLIIPSSQHHHVVEQPRSSHISRYSVPPPVSIPFSSLPPWIPSHSNPITNPSSNMVTKEAYKHRMKTINKFKKESSPSRSASLSPSPSPSARRSHSYDSDDIVNQQQRNRRKVSPFRDERERERIHALVGGQKKILYSPSQQQPRNSLSPSYNRRRRTPSPKKVKQQDLSISDRVDRLK
jgi:hypothetical protein